MPSALSTVTAVPVVAVEAARTGHAVLVKSSSGLHLLTAARVRQGWAQRFEDDPQAVVVAAARFGEFFTGSLPHPALPAEVRARVRDSPLTVELSDGTTHQKP